jgi:integrase
MIDALDHEQIVGLPARLQQPLGEPARVVSRKRRGEGNGRRRRKGEGLGVGTIRAICQTASRVLEFATQMGWRGGAKVPLSKVAVPDSEWLSVDELESLLEIAGEHRIAYMLGARAGLRRGEIVELRWKDVDLANARLRVSRAYKRLDNLEWTVGPTKGGRARTVPIPQDLVHALAEIAGSPNDLVARTAKGERIEPWRLSESARQDAAKAGIDRPGIGAHTLRHTYCSHLAQGGASTRAIQMLAGHASLRTTERYMHLSPSHIEQAIAHLPMLRGSEETVQKVGRTTRKAPALRLV